MNNQKPRIPAHSPDIIESLKEWCEVQREIDGKFDDDELSGCLDADDCDPCFTRDLDLED